jgi:hypothetical protein
MINSFDHWLLPNYSFKEDYNSHCTFWFDVFLRVTQLYLRIVCSRIWNIPQDLCFLHVFLCCRTHSLRVHWGRNSVFSNLWFLLNSLDLFLLYLKCLVLNVLISCFLFYAFRFLFILQNLDNFNICIDFRDFLDCTTHPF